MRKMLKEKTWEEFRETGLLFFINQILHAFGWTIVVEVENNKVVKCYPAQTKFRGFGEKSINEGYGKISKYLKINGPKL